MEQVKVDYHLEIRRDKERLRRSEISDKEELRLNSLCELKHLLISLFLSPLFLKTSALNNLRKKETSLTLEKDERIAERVRSYPFLYDKTRKEHKEKGCSRKCMEKVDLPNVIL